MNFCDRAHVASMLAGKSVALVGSGPGCAENKPGLVDSFDVVVRVNNFRIMPGTGKRTDVYYSYFGNAIRKTAAELQRGGVKLCMCKCPNAQFIESEWHRDNDKMIGVDFRWIYEKRADWWFCPTYVPPLDDFLAYFELLGKHVPTTGFAALLDVLSFGPSRVFMTGFDFFITGLHNVRDKWRPGNPSDPIGHDPKAELAWLREHLKDHPIELDGKAMAAVLGKLKPPGPTEAEKAHARKVERKERRNANARLAIH